MMLCEENHATFTCDIYNLGNLTKTMSKLVFLNTYNQFEKDEPAAFVAISDKN